MTRPNGSMLLLLVTSCVLSDQQDKVTLGVHYLQRSFTPTRGSSVKLSCDVSYDFDLCGLLCAQWYRLNRLHAELTDPSKYFTTVNETVSDDSVRRRRVVTEILDMTPEDNGQFQCKAECENGETAMGHYIMITVQG